MILGEFSLTYHPSSEVARFEPSPRSRYILWMGQRNPKNQLKTVVNPVIFLGFQPSFWWCRISQPSTVCITGKSIMRGLFFVFSPLDTLEVPARPLTKLHQGCSAYKHPWFQRIIWQGIKIYSAYYIGTIYIFIVT